MRVRRAVSRFGFAKRNPNFPKSTQIQPSPAKDNQRKSLVFLRRIQAFQRLTPTPRPLFSWADSGFSRTKLEMYISARGCSAAFCALAARLIDVVMDAMYYEFRFSGRK
jgi:hypothetical protein